MSDTNPSPSITIGVTLQEGRYYVTKDGQKVGPASKHDRNDNTFRIPGQFNSRLGKEWSGQLYCADGSVYVPLRDEAGDTIVAEWIEPSTDGPVRRVTTTRTEICPGLYERIAVGHSPRTEVVRVAFAREIWSGIAWEELTADECRALARTIDQLGDALDAIKAERGGK